MILGSYINKRILAGAFLHFVLVGEVTVAASNGLLQPVGIVALLFLYVIYFRLLDLIIYKYKLRPLGIVLVNYALYSVLITGLLHGEISNFSNARHEEVITTLIRIQCSLFPIFTYIVLEKSRTLRIAVNTASIAKYNFKNTLIPFFVYALILTPSESFGLFTIAKTFKNSPLLTILFCISALAAYLLGTKIFGNTTTANNQNLASLSKNRVYIMSAYGLLLVGLIPGIVPFMILLILMILSSFYILLNTKNT